MNIELEEIPQTPIEKAFGSYWFVHADYSEGLNYQISKEVSNSSLDAIEKVIEGSTERVEDSLPAKEYLEMMFPLLQKVQAKLRGQRSLRGY